MKLARERYNQHTRGAPFRNHLLSESFFAPCVAHPTPTSAATQPYSLFWSLSPHCAHLAGLPAHLAPTFAQDPECWLPFLTIGPPRPLDPGAQVQLVFSGTSNTPIHRSWSPNCLLSCLPMLHLPSPDKAGHSTSFGFCFFLVRQRGYSWSCSEDELCGFGCGVGSECGFRWRVRKRMSWEHWPSGASQKNQAKTLLQPPPFPEAPSPISWSHGILGELQKQRSWGWEKPGYS